MRKWIAFFLIGIVYQSMAQIKFEELDWEKALTKSKSNNQPMFVYAYASWSEPCQLLEKYTLADLEVSNFYNEQYVNVKLDVETYPGIALAEQYGIDIYPTFLFLSPEGELLHRGCGAIEASAFLDLGKEAVGTDSYKTLAKRFDDGDRSGDFLLQYFQLMEENCLDAERFASRMLAEESLKELEDETSFLLIEGYQWDIFSREFQYLMDKKDRFENVVGSERVNDKLFNTFLAQYQEIYDAEELHLFGMRALLNEMKRVRFTGSDTLSVMMNLHYFELIEDWENFAETSIDWVGMTGLDDPEELSDLAWKFYLFVDKKEQLGIAAGWAEELVNRSPEPSIIDTYASLLFKMGDKKKAINLEKQALEMATELLEDTSHYEHQLKKFEEK